MKPLQSFAALLQAYFTERLVRQRNASPNTVASHRDTFRLLLGFAQKSLKKPPAALAISDLDAPFSVMARCALPADHWAKVRTDGPG